MEKVRRAYERDSEALFAYALSLTGCYTTAEDAVHAAFSKVLQNGARPKVLRPYLFRCVRNAAIDAHRVQERRDQRESIFVALHTPETAASAFHPLDLDAALDTLNEDERECVLLKSFNGLTYREIGDVKGVSPNTVASWHRRALVKLRDELEETDHG